MSGKGKEEEVSASDSSSESDEHKPAGETDDYVEILTEGAKGPTIPTMFGPLEKFEAIEENVPNHPAVLLAGKRRTGKSTTLDNFLSKTARHIPFGIVMTDTPENGFWQQRVPERFITRGWREDWLDALIKRQKGLIEKYGKEDPRTFAFIILDDVIANQKQIRYSDKVAQLFVQGRHTNLSVYITTQYMKGIGPMLRGNMDIVFLQPIYSIADREVIHALYGGFIPKKDFMQFMDQVVMAKEKPDSTAQHPKLDMQIMVVQDWRQTCVIQKKFKFWDPVHSNDLEPYKLLAAEYWKKDANDHFGKVEIPQQKRSLVDTLDEVNSVFRG